MGSGVLLSGHVSLMSLFVVYPRCVLRIVERRGDFVACPRPVTKVRHAHLTRSAHHLVIR